MKFKDFIMSFSNCGKRLPSDRAVAMSEIAEACGVKDTAVRRWITRGKMPKLAKEKVEELYKITLD